MIERKDWVWMPHPGHFICAFDCRFRLNTRVGDYIISTVGEMFPDYRIREITAQVLDIKLTGLGDDRDRDYMKKIGYEEIGYNRKYETMVFYAQEGEVDCCPWRADTDKGEVDMEGYNDPTDAYKGHLELCEKYAAMQGNNNV